MAKTRDDKFKLSFDMFIKDVVGVRHYSLTNLTRNKSEKSHIYELKIPLQLTVIGFIDRDGVTYTRDDVLNMDIQDDIEASLKTEYVPNIDEFEKQFNDTFDPYSDNVVIPSSNSNMPPYTYPNSFVTTNSMVINDEGHLQGKICVVYYKKHIPYPVETDDSEYEKKYLSLLKRFNKTEQELSRSLTDIDELQDDLLYNERQLRISKKVLYRETNNNKLCQMNLINKLQEAYKTLPTKEDCPVCYETIENDKLVIPNCSHYICNECHPRCSSCPICRVKYK
tara:strand:- start:3150 stop:3992 length:843 start_codon:yes stop_codon:yes gene_type:complete